MISAQYLGMPLEINDLDHENLTYFSWCAKHDFRLQRCASCKLLRYPPSTACPWCAEPASEWVSVEGRGIASQQPHPAAQALRMIGEFAAHVVHLSQHDPRMMGERIAGRSRRDAATAAFEQRQSGRILHAAQPRARRGQSHMRARRALRDGSGFDDMKKEAEIGEVEAHDVEASTAVAFAPAEG